MLALTSLHRLGVRTAHAHELPWLARIRRESWQAAYGGVLPEAELRGMDDGRTAARMARGLASSWQGINVVHDEHDTAIGYAWFGPHRERMSGHRGEIYELYLHPRAQGQGAGRRLLVDTIWSLVGRRLHPVLVWVLAANPARHFYSACGGVPIAQGPVTVAGKTLTRLAFSWADALPLPA